MITTATPAHAAALAAIHTRCFTGKDAWTAEALATLVAAPGITGLIHTTGGFILLRRAADQADLVTLAVLPEARRKGLAKTLLALALETLRDHGVKDVFLEVATANAPAAALYRQQGFVPTGRRPAYYADGGDALLMHLSLLPPPP